MTTHTTTRQFTQTASDFNKMALELKDSRIKVVQLNAKYQPSTLKRDLSMTRVRDSCFRVFTG